MLMGKKTFQRHKPTDQLVSTVKEGNLKAADLAPVIGSCY